MQASTAERAPVADTSHFVTSLSAFGGAQLVSWLVTLTLLFLLPRFYSDTIVGKLVLASTLSTLIGLVTELGVTTYLAREIARDPSRADWLIGQVLGLRTVLSCLGLALTVTSAHIAGYDEATRQVIYVFCIGYLWEPLATVVNGSLQGFHQLKAMAGAATVLSLLRLTLTILIIYLGGGLLVLAGAELLTGALSLALATRVMLRFARLSFRFEWSAWRGIVQGGLPFFTWGLATLVYSKADILQLSLMTSDAVVGWYAVAYRIIGIPAFLPSIIMAVTFPALSATLSDPATFNGIARRSLRAVLLTCLPLGLGIMLLADKAVGLLVFSDGFASSVILIVILAPHVVLVGLNMQLATVLNTSGGHWKWTTSAIVASVMAPVLNLVAIPYTHEVYGNGAIGASLVTVLTEVVLFVAALRLMPPGLIDGATARYAMRCLAAGIAMAAIVWPARELPIVAPIALGGLTYGLASLALGAVSIDDLRALRHIWRRPAPTAASA
jgi:O-antigen/teichoic acid export membrane protein